MNSGLLVGLVPCVMGQNTGEGIKVNRLPKLD